MDSQPHIHVKVSCPDRHDADGDPWNDFANLVRPLVEDYPDRALWGTDRPHPKMESNIPDGGRLVDMTSRIAITEELQHNLLMENPMRLYWADEQ